MKADQLHALLKRVESWPKGAQQEAVQVLREIEEDFVVGPETVAELNQAHQDTLRGKGISLEDLRQRLDV
jgi:hypothetical protein